MVRHVGWSRRLEIASPTDALRAAEANPISRRRGGTGRGELG
jgi:hypothetical protein